MALARVLAQDINLVNSYETGRLVLRDQSFQQSVLLTPTSCNSIDLPASLADFTEATWEHLCQTARDNEVVLIGSGEKQQFLPTEARPIMTKHQQHPEVMTTLAACKTYNLLAAEGRLVLAILIV